MSRFDMLMINEWTVLAHPLFLNQWEKLIEAVDALKAKKSEDYQKSIDAKPLAALIWLVTVTVPSDPTAAIYRQDSPLVLIASTGSAPNSATAVSGFSSATAAPAR